jgi:hypothetical protein
VDPFKDDVTVILLLGVSFMLLYSKLENSPTLSVFLNVYGAQE